MSEQHVCPLGTPPAPPPVDGAYPESSIVFRIIDGVVTMWCGLCGERLR